MNPMKRAGTRKRDRALHVLVFGLILAVVLSGCTLMVQPVLRYESPDALFTLDYPLEWDIVNESFDRGLTSVLFGSFPRLIEMDSIPPGEAGMGVTLLPDVVPVGPEETLHLPADAFGAMLQAEAERVEDYVSPLEEVEIEGMSGVYGFQAVSESGARDAYFFSPEEGLVAVYIVVHGAEDDTTELQRKVEESIASFRVIGDVEDFMQNAQVPRVVGP